MQPPARKGEKKAQESGETGITNKILEINASIRTVNGQIISV